MKTVEFDNGILQPFNLDYHDMVIGKDTPWGKVVKIHDSLVHNTLNANGKAVVAIEIDEEERTAFFEVGAGLYEYMEEAMDAVVSYLEYEEENEEKIICKMFKCHHIKSVYEENEEEEEDDC